MRKLLYSLLVIFSPVWCNAQLVIPEELQQIRKQLEGAQNIAYRYLITQKMDGSTHQIKGDIQKGDGYLLETNGEQQVIQTHKWFYKIDHSSKTVYVVDLRRFEKGKNIKSSAGNSYLIPDSLIVKYGTLDIKTNGDLLRVNIAFSREIFVKNFYVEYDKAKKQIVSFKLKATYPYGIDGSTYEEKMVEQEMVADQFSLKKSTVKPNLEEYFTISKGKVILKKYANYELVAEI
jgi:hypothetical protein